MYPNDLSSRALASKETPRMKGEDNLELAKLEAMRLAAKSSKRHFVIDLSTVTVMFETQVPRTTKPSRHQ